MTGQGGPNVPLLTPGTPPQMLGEAIGHLRSLPLDPALRADSFAALAAQIETQSAGAWKVVRGTGTDGADVFLGRRGEGLVVRPDGRLFRGNLGRGIDITARELRPDYGTLKPLD